MRINSICDDLRQMANTPEQAGPLMARAAAEIEYLKSGYHKILGLSDDALMRGQARKIAEDYI